MKITLKALRVNTNLTQESVAKNIGVTKETLRNWESYETYPTAQQLVKLCEIYHCGLDDVYIPEMQDAEPATI